MRFIALLLPLCAPLFARATTTLKGMVDGTIVPIGELIIQVLYALAFLFFLFGMARLYFSNSEEDWKKGKQFAIWGVIGLALLFGVWGVVRLLLGILTGFST